MYNIPSYLLCPSLSWSPKSIKLHCNLFYRLTFMSQNMQQKIDLQKDKTVSEILKTIKIGIIGCGIIGKSILNALVFLFGK